MIWLYSVSIAICVTIVAMWVAIIVALRTMKPDKGRAMRLVRLGIAANWFSLALLNIAGLIYFTQLGRSAVMVVVVLAQVVFVVLTRYIGPHRNKGRRGPT